MGVSWQEFWGMNPHIIKLISKGHYEKVKEQDYLAWISNQYTLSAVSMAVEHNLAGRKARSKYIEKPLLAQVEERNKPLSQEEIERQRLLFISKMNIMKKNFDMNRDDKEIYIKK